MTLHPILSRQLRRLGLDAESPPAADTWRLLLAAIDASYRGADEDRYTIERAFELSSKEMNELHAQLAAATENKLAHNAAMLSATIEAMDEGLVVMDRVGGTLLHNRRYLEMWGLEVHQLQPDILREHFLAHLTVEDAAAVAANFESEDAPPFERVFHLRDGRHFRASSSPLMVGAELIGRVWLVHDETERHDREREVREARRFLDSILEHLPDMVFVKDADSLAFVTVNRAGEELIGLPRETLVGRSDFDFFPRDEAESFVSRDREVLENGELSEVEEQLSTPLGERLLHTKKIPILDDAGRPRFLLGISRDVTERRRRNEELLAAKQAAERASRAKSEFLSNMSHELRTPLNAILGFAEMIAHEAIGPLNGHQKDAISDIRQAGTYMAELVDSLLALRDANGSPSERTIDFHDLGTILREVQAIAAPLAIAREETLTFAPCDHLPPVQCEPRALFQVLMNLITNAMKFTGPGGRIAVHVESLTGDLVEIAVEDTGVGIAAHDLPHVFSYFTQGGRLGHKMQGTGVSLALTRALVEQMGGVIVAESALGQGSVFRVRLHMASAVALPRSRALRSRPVTDRPQRGESWRYLAQPETTLAESVLAQWHDSDPAAGVLAFVPEAERAFVPELQALARRKGIELVGAVFPEIIVEAEFRTHGILLFELAPMPPWLIVDGLGTPQSDTGAIEALSAFADKSTTPHTDTLFMVFDGQLPHIGSLVEGIYRQIGDHVHFAGVNSGSGTFKPMPCIFDDTRIVERAVLALHLAEHPGAALDHGYSLPEAHMLATSTGGNRILRVDWEPAFDGYRSFVRHSYGVEIDHENFYEQAVHFPFAMVRADGEAIIRVPVGLGDHGELLCVGEVPDGAVITVARACVPGQLTSVDSVTARLGETSALLFVCAGRRTHLGPDASLAEVVAFAARTRGPTLGAVSLGEIGEARHGGYPLFHNATLVALPWITSLRGRS